MAFNSNPGRAEYTSSSGQTVFTFVFKIYEDGDIKAYQTLAGETANDEDDLLTITTDYTVDITGDTGGSITLTSGAALNDNFTLVRELAINRAIEFQTSGDMRATTINADQNYQTYLIADQEANSGRQLRLPASVQGVSSDLPAPVSDAYFKWNSEADAIENDTTIPDAVIAAGDSATAAATSADNAELFEWEAEAEALTALSYAIEAEDTPVNVVTSDGDGTFTYTPQAGVFSSLHWAAKASVFNPASYALLAGATFTGQAKGITPVANEDLTRKDYVDANMVNATAEVITEGQNWTDGIDIGGGETLYPDGTIVGTNANGTYTKYPNGDFIAEHKILITGGSLTVTLPLTAIDVDTRVASNALSSASRAVVLGSITTTTVGFQVFTTNTAANIESNIHYIAKGRYK